MILRGCYSVGQLSYRCNVIRSFLVRYSHERSLTCDDEVGPSPFVDQLGVGLDPYPATCLSQQSEHCQATLSSLNHCQTNSRCQDFALNFNTVNHCRSQKLIKLIKIKWKMYHP